MRLHFAANCIGIGLGLFAVLGAAVYRANQPYFGWDLAVSHAVQGISWPGVESLLRGVCLADNDLFQAALLVAGVSLVLATRRAWREAAILVAVVAVGLALCTLSGYLVGRPRPSTQLIQLRIDPKEIEGFPSFPSGHTMHAVAFAWQASAHFPELGWVLVPLAALIAASRVVLGLHYPSDVLAGAAIGAALAELGTSLA